MNILAMTIISFGDLSKTLQRFSCFVFVVFLCLVLLIFAFQLMNVDMYQYQIYNLGLLLIFVIFRFTWRHFYFRFIFDLLFFGNYCNDSFLSLSDFSSLWFYDFMIYTLIIWHIVCSVSLQYSSRISSGIVCGKTSIAPSNSNIL